jgi:hypothetical protein
VVLAEGANGNTIGGPDPADRNVFAATVLGNGVVLTGDATRDNVIQGNYIGTDPTGARAMGLESGIAISNLANDNQVLGNVISGNRGAGIFSVDASLPFGRTQTLVEGNHIGTDPTGEQPVPNLGYGLRIEGQSKDVRVRRNLVRFNRNGGILVCGTQTRSNTLTENRVTDNRGPAIQVCDGANEGVLPPAIVQASLRRAGGTACPRCRIELFSDPGEQADTFEGATVADDAGTWALDKPEGFKYQDLTATATDGQSTSGLSEPAVAAPDAPTPTPTAGGPGPSPEPTQPNGALDDVFLPWLGRGAGR